MWPRVAELMIGCWLIVSPFVFRGTESIEHFTAVDLTAGGLVVTWSLLSFWHRTAWARFGTMATAALLGAWAYLAWPRPGPPAAQNEIAVALVLVLLSLIPNDANEPPAPWRAAH